MDLPKYVLRKKGAQKLLPQVSKLDHKGSRGKSLIIAGSQKYPGAGILSSRAALRSGSGYVYWSEQNLKLALDFPDTIPFKFSAEEILRIEPNGILIGPGCEVTESLAKSIQTLKKHSLSVVVDADALTVSAKKNLFPFPKSWISTPHPGELARCLGCSPQLIQSDRYKFIQEGQIKIGGVVLLKGAETLVCDGKRICRIPVGNEALAKSGTGDVLAGMITAFRAQGLSPFRASLLGAYVHGLTSELWVASGRDPLGMTASDVIDWIPMALNKLRELEMR